MYTHAMSHCPFSRPIMTDPVGQAWHNVLDVKRRAPDTPSLLGREAMLAGTMMTFRHACITSCYPDAVIQLTGADGSMLWWSPVRERYLHVSKGHVHELKVEEYGPVWNAMHAGLRAANPELEPR